MKMIPNTRIEAWFDYNRQKRFQWETPFPKDIWFRPLASMYTRKRRR